MVWFGSHASKHTSRRLPNFSWMFECLVFPSPFCDTKIQMVHEKMKTQLSSLGATGVMGSVSNQTDVLGIESQVTSSCVFIRLVQCWALFIIVLSPLCMTYDPVSRMSRISNPLTWTTWSFRSHSFVHNIFPSLPSSSILLSRHNCSSVSSSSPPLSYIFTLPWASSPVAKTDMKHESVSKIF